MQKLPYFLSPAKSHWLSLSTSAKCAGLQPTLPARSSRYAQCVQHTTEAMLSKNERYYGLGMDALVIVCSRNTNVIMVGAWMLW